MKRIAFKLCMFFISLLCIAFVLAFIVSTLFTGNVKNEIRINQQDIASSIQQLSQKTDLSIEEIIQITSTPMYVVRVIDDINTLRITEEQLSRIHNKEVVLFYPRVFHGSMTVFMLDKSYIAISLHPNNNILKVVVSRVWLGMLSYTFIGAILIIILGKMAVRPILKLNLATQQVAKGNFDIQIENHSNDEIGQLTKNFNKMTRELKSIEYLRKDFITSVSHEFKTPIASIQGFAKLLQRGNLSEEEVLEYTSIIVEETKRLSNLSSNILKLSKLENQEIVEKKVRFSLDEQIRKSILLLEHEWGKKNIQFDIELDRINYIGDEELLYQVWINIINNAIKFSDENGIVKITLNQKGPIIQVRVRDYGIGMSEETKSRVFEKFYQGDEAHSWDGNGLGLSLVKRILDLCGAEIRVESKLNEGSTFIIELPLV